jgi:mxaJ protein
MMGLCRLARKVLGAAIICTMTLVVSSAGPAKAETAPALRVCADPNNLPYSDASGRGFENKLAEMIARDMRVKLTYVWWAQRRGFVRNTLKAGDCDLIMGVPAHYDPVETTQPYYRSGYVFVSRADRRLGIRSLTDPRLHNVKIGVHLIGDDGANTPPVEVLGRQGIIENVIGYSIYGDYRQATPPARLIEAVERGDIDIAAAWGPLAGYEAKHSTVPLDVSLIEDTEQFSPLRFQFDIAMGVRKGNERLRQKLDHFIRHRQSEIRSLLDQYAVPFVPMRLSASKTE